MEAMFRQQAENYASLGMLTLTSRQLQGGLEIICSTVAFC